MFRAFAIDSIDRGHRVARFTANSRSRAVSPGALLWTHRSASCNVIPSWDKEEARTRPVRVPLSGTSFSSNAVTWVPERNGPACRCNHLMCCGMRDLGFIEVSESGIVCRRSRTRCPRVSREESRNWELIEWVIWIISLLFKLFQCLNFIRS